MKEIDLKTVDPASILFSMPTIAADAIDYVAPDHDSAAGVPLFHEDEWLQLQFFPSSRREEIQAMLTEYKAFEAENRLEVGWKNLFVRQLDQAELLSGLTQLEPFGRLRAGPILFSGQQALGQVKHGFSLELGENAHLYGQLDGQGKVVLLAAHLAGAEDSLLSQLFFALNQRDGLILVDWRQQMLLMTSKPTGEIGVWRP